ncbi:MAG: hypothetical protein OXG97_10120 [Candidatus Poribacteria bacterium]|nr:hypothetical protein [Candidatus Poribacteria bacterium]
MKLSFSLATLQTLGTLGDFETFFSELREWWYTKETGIYMIEEGLE